MYVCLLSVCLVLSLSLSLCLSVPRDRKRVGHRRAGCGIGWATEGGSRAEGESRGRGGPRNGRLQDEGRAPEGVVKVDRGKVVGSCKSLNVLPQGPIFLLSIKNYLSDKFPSSPNSLTIPYRGTLKHRSILHLKHSCTIGLCFRRWLLTLAGEPELLRFFLRRGDFRLDPRR